MSKQYSTTLRNAWLATYESTIGTAPKLRIYSGAPPANCAASASGTLLIEMTLPSDWMGAPSGGSSALAGSWTGTVSADGTAGYYRIVDSAGTTVHEQGAITRAFAITTSSATAAASNVLTFAATTGVAAAMSISGAGVESGATALSVGSTTVTMSAASTAGVSSGVPIYFGDTSGDMWLQSTAMTVGQTLTISARTLTAPGA